MALAVRGLTSEILAIVHGRVGSPGFSKNLAMPFLDGLRKHIHRILLGEGRDFSQRRRHSRILCSLPVVLIHGEESRRAVLADLSLEGARLQMLAEPNRLGICRPPFRRGQNLLMALAYGQTGRPERQARVVVRWVRPGLKGWDVGVHLKPGGEAGWVARILSEYGLSQDAFHTRRTEARAEVRQQIKVRLGEKHSIPAELLDLSLGGAAIVTARALAPFVPVRMELRLAGQDLLLPAQVVHVRSHRGEDFHHQSQWLCGLRFGELTRDQAEQVGQHLVTVSRGQ